MSRLWLIVPAAGKGSRMGAQRPKQYLPLGERCVLELTLTRLHQAFPEAQLRLCLAEDDHWFDPTWVPFADWQRVAGGEQRADSVRQALASLEGQAADDDLVLVHDVARPCVDLNDLARLLEALVDDPVGALLAAPVADTMKRADATKRVAVTESRESLWHALTPQGFRFRLLVNALDEARRLGVTVTDEASAVEALGHAPRLIAGRRDNLKITHPEDLMLAEQILAAQRNSCASLSSPDKEAAS
ncbi:MULTISPECIES: 2-C-methyl-D-erythritol 4-phosphate cytidylyltransferase [Halomonadaceae]|uniref:2-C-methyl-D-erythritol 4-phosphate cytidylyltransferase n=1 Tax=Halomonadaceae TaxID=28256 RepID=UPI001597E2CA|nr:MULTISPECIES: 2-C-methyl-D-erythritol 4-phosphate cytidylyltransferase [Halomonas]QJQ96075.1 2-C-methyl-D-erythritol 4-phosphate cytidylyltransferase [Halomonas sp. PA5]